MRDIALKIELGLLLVGRGRQGDHPEHTRADPLGDRFDGATFTGAIAAFKDNADLQSLTDHPLLQFNQLNVELAQRFFILFVAKRLHFGRTRYTLGLLVVSHGYRSVLRGEMGPVYRKV